MEATAFLVEALVWYVVYKKPYKVIIVYKLFKLAGKLLITYCWDYFTKMSTNVAMYYFQYLACAHLYRYFLGMRQSHPHYLSLSEAKLAPQMERLSYNTI